MQSYCLYAAVARLPVALALLTFNLFPLLLAAISWLAGGQRPGRRTLIAMPVILLGLTLALNIRRHRRRKPRRAPAGALRPRWAAMSAGVAFAFTAATSFAAGPLPHDPLAERRRRPAAGRADDGDRRDRRRAAGRLGRRRARPGRGIRRPAGTAFSLPDAPLGWLGLVLLSLLYTVAFMTLFVLLPRLGAVNNAPIMNFEPIAALILGSQILGQKVLPVQIAGALLVIGAIVFLSTGPRR